MPQLTISLSQFLLVIRDLAGLLMRHLIVLLSAFSLAGCIEAPEQTAEPRVESSPRVVPWDEQLAAVRTGESDAVRHADVGVNPGQWAELQEGCESLRVLEADFRLLTAEDLMLLVELPSLEQLKLTGPVDDAAMAEIGRVKQLRFLNLPDGVFTNDGISHLSPLHQLELLRFRSPHVGNEAMTTIAALPQLRFLHLIDVPITDDGLKPLWGKTDLESFYLDGSQCTDDGLSLLLDKLPELHFHRDQLHLPDDPNTHPHK